VEAYVAAVVANAGVGVGSVIVQEMGDGLGGGLYSLGTGGCKGAKGDEEGGVDGTSVVQERADAFWSLVRPLGFRVAELPSSGII
jgi:hypothetical protein